MQALEAECADAKQRAEAAAAALLEREAALAAAEAALEAVQEQSGAPAVPTGEISDGAVEAAMAAGGTAADEAGAAAQPRAPIPTPARLATSTPPATPMSAAGSAAAAATTGSSRRSLRDAEYAIEGAKVDNPAINPALALAGVIDYVNEWRDALAPEPGGGQDGAAGSPTRTAEGDKGADGAEVFAAAAAAVSEVAAAAATAGAAIASQASSKAYEKVAQIDTAQVLEGVSNDAFDRLEQHVDASTHWRAASSAVRAPRRRRGGGGAEPPAPAATVQAVVAEPEFDLKAHEAAELERKQAEAAKKAKEKEELEAKNAARDAELAAKGKRAAGGMHKFDPDEVDVHGGKATADEFMDAFGI